MSAPATLADPLAVLDVAARFRDRALGEGRSLFTAARTWSLPTLRDLHQRFVGQYDMPGATFERKWAGQLAEAPDPTLLAAAELLYVHVLFATDLSPRTKRKLVTTTLGWADGDPVTVPDNLDRALGLGIARTGIAFKARRQSQLRFLLEAALAWRAAQPARRATLATDPWACKETLFALPHDGAYAQRAALLHLLHPDTFEPMVSERVKRRVVAAHTEVVPDGVDDVDWALQHVRAALTPTFGQAFSFVDDPVAATWR